jgi:L-ascorbate metabolism protein UlaG (beta-lactamase superfamily)
MLITWLGQYCFKIQEQNTTIVIDPYDQSTGLKLPRLKADILLMTEGGAEHGNAAAVGGEPFVIDGPGEYEVKNIFVYGLPFISEKQKDQPIITLYLIKIGEITMAHLGGLKTTLGDEQLEILEGTDILLVPVGGKSSLTAEAASHVISQIEPRIVIPMNYKIPGLKTSADPVNKFSQEMGVKGNESVDKVKIFKKDLPQEETKIIIMEPSR